MSAARPDLLRYDDVMIALSKAQAMRHLLRAATDEDMPWSRVAPGRTPPRRIKEHVEWIQMIAFDALENALAEAEAAFRRSRKNTPDAAPPHAPRPEPLKVVDFVTARAAHESD